MRKPRDFDAELKALGDKARDLKSRKVQQLGELVMATGADALNANELAGALIVLAMGARSADYGVRVPPNSRASIGIIYFARSTIVIGTPPANANTSVMSLLRRGWRCHQPCRRRRHHRDLRSGSEAIDRPNG
jgi:Conjugal transfer protein TraD